MMHIPRMLACSLLGGCLTALLFSSALPVKADAPNDCSYVTITAGGTTTCMQSGPPQHITQISQICSKDVAGESVVLFQDDITHQITPILPGKCISLNNQSGTIAFN